MNPSIKSYSLEDLKALMVELGQSSFRARQLFQWLYSHHVASYSDMTNLPAKLRNALEEQIPFNCPEIVDKQISSDGTRKYVIEYDDSAKVEMVAIPSQASHERLTVCFSTQAGCAMACTFCATGREGLTRSLEPGEMVDQILIAQEDFGKRVTNVVGMGQGEPFLNYSNTLKALRIMNSSDGLGIGARHIAVSTCGIISGVEKFATEPEQFTLAISLHAARQNVRNTLMPKIATQPLPELRNAVEHYIKNTNRRVTFEYIMISGINDQAEDLEALVNFCKGLLCHVNLIPANSISSSPFKPSSNHTIQQWIDRLQKTGTEATVRQSRGSDIAGACGQLKNVSRETSHK